MGRRRPWWEHVPVDRMNRRCPKTRAGGRESRVADSDGTAGAPIDRRSVPGADAATAMAPGNGGISAARRRRTTGADPVVGGTSAALAGRNANAAARAFRGRVSSGRITGTTGSSLDLATGSAPPVWSGPGGFRTVSGAPGCAARFRGWRPCHGRSSWRGGAAAPSREGIRPCRRRRTRSPDPILREARGGIARNGGGGRIPAGSPGSRRAGAEAAVGGDGSGTPDRRGGAAAWNHALRNSAWVASFVRETVPHMIFSRGCWPVARITWRTRPSPGVFTVRVGRWKGGRGVFHMFPASGDAETARPVGDPRVFRVGAGIGNRGGVLRRSDVTSAAGGADSP